MKKIIFMLIATAFLASPALAFTAPGNADLDILLADPGSLENMLKGATPQEAADVVMRAIWKIDASNLTAAQKSTARSMLIAYAIVVLDNQAATTTSDAATRDAILAWQSAAPASQPGSRFVTLIDVARPGLTGDALQFAMPLFAPRRYRGQ